MLTQQSPERCRAGGDESSGNLIIPPSKTKFSLCAAAEKRSTWRKKPAERIRGIFYLLSKCVDECVSRYKNITITKVLIMIKI